MNEVVDWDQQCPLEVVRKVAGQHGNCATCAKWVGYDANGERVFPPKCLWLGWMDPFGD